MCLCINLLTLLGLAQAQVWGLQIYPHPPMDLLVMQQGYPEAWVKGARFEGRGLEPFPVVRGARGVAARAVETEAGGEILQQFHVTDY